ncbi:MAG: phage protein GemA/Gp16 family protein [Fusobacterium gastrosuis]|uniref:phage protein GemA/Gp16 family protein n=1 Tax=Fusobacterium gastrosuis TaxID=1755100 RepID=UPI002A8935CD|nr:phage protein GemA/Gp16 family protein [Fusobacterium gastrosuis]
MKEITAQQIKRIHTLKSLARLDEINYRLLLSSKFNKNSSKDLTEAQASVLIRMLDKLANKDRATDKQIRRLELLFNKIYPNEEIKEFIAEELKIKKTTKQLTTKEASKLIYILEQIEKWKKGQ